MGMQIEKSFTVRAARAAVWEFLIDPYRVARCLPGAAITEKLDETTYAGTIAVKVGPVTASYRGKLKFERLDAEAGEAELSGAGQETKGKGGADMRMKSRLVERTPGETEVTVTSDVNVFGILAQMGRGMVQDVSDQLFQKFSDAMRRELETAAPPAVSGSPAPGTEAPSPGASASLASTPPPQEPAPRASITVTPALSTPHEDVLDVGSIGARAASRALGRTVRRPAFWLVLLALIVLLYWLLR